MRIRRCRLSLPATFLSLQTFDNKIQPFLFHNKMFNCSTKFKCTTERFCHRTRALRFGYRYAQADPYTYIFMYVNICVVQMWRV